MQTVFEIVRELFGLGRDIYNCVNMDELRDVHKKFVARTIWILVLILIVMVTLNCFGQEKVNLIISLFLSIAAALILTRSEFLVATAAVGVVSGITQDPNAIKAELKKFFTFHFRTVGDVILWTSIFGLFLGTISCRENPGAVFSIAVALIVIGYGSYRFKFTTGLYKKIVYYYAILVLIVSLLSLIPAHSWIHWTGHDLGYFFHKSEMETALSKVEKAQREVNESKEKAALNIIEEKIKNGKKLSQIEKDFLEDMRKERKRNSLPGIISGGIPSSVEEESEADTETKTNTETEIAAKKAMAETAEKEEVARIRSSWQATPSAPQTEVAVKKPFSPKKMEIDFQGKRSGYQIEIERFDDNIIEFVQIWTSGKRIYYKGQRTGEDYEGFCQYAVEGRTKEHGFTFNPKTMEGRVEQPKDQYATFRLI